MSSMNLKCFVVSYTKQGLHGPHKVCTILRNEHPLTWLHRINTTSFDTVVVLDWYKELTSDEVHHLNSTSNIIIDCAEYSIPLQ